ncbi:predicted protein, partial [Naegleria gruberi]
MIIAIIAALSSSIVIVIVGLLFGVYSSFKIVKPFHNLIDLFASVSNMDLDNIIVLPSPFREVHQLQLHFKTMVVKIKQYRCFIPPHLLAQIDAEGAGDENDRDFEKPSIRAAKDHNTTQSSLRSGKSSRHSGISRSGNATSNYHSTSNQSSFRPVSKSLFKLGLEKKKITVANFYFVGLDYCMENLSDSELVTVMSDYFEVIQKVAKLTLGQLGSFEDNSMTISWNSTSEVSNHEEKGVASSHQILLKLSQLKETKWKKKEHLVKKDLLQNVDFRASILTQVCRCGTQEIKTYSIVGSYLHNLHKIMKHGLKLNVKLIASEETLFKSNDTHQHRLVGVKKVLSPDETSAEFFSDSQKKKQKQKKAKKEKELWGDDVSPMPTTMKDYFAQLSQDCSEQEATILDHEPVQHCKKERNPPSEKKKEKKKNAQPASSSVAATSSDVVDNDENNETDRGKTQESKKKKQMSNSDYLELLESSLDDEEKMIYSNSSRITTTAAMTSYIYATPYKVLPPVQPPKRIELPPTFDKIEDLLKELSLTFEYFKVQDNSTSKTIYLEKLVHMTDSLSKKCFQKADKNAIFMLGGLNFVCVLFAYFASGENENEQYEKIINSLSYVLYRFSDHNRARSAMLTTGVFYSLWYVGGLSKNISTLSHVNEVIDLLGGQLSIGFELSNLLTKSNSQLLDISYISTEKTVDSSSQTIYSDGFTFPDTFLGVGTDFVSLSENNFPIQLHYSIIISRTSNFLSDFCVKWDPTTGQVVENSKNPGFYLMKDSNISWYALLKFVQLLYTDKISVCKEERERELKNRNSIFESKLVSEGFPRLLTTLRNQKTRENAINCMSTLTSMEDHEECDNGGLFDEFDNELVNDELNYFFGKPLNYWYLPKPKENNFSTDFLRKKEKIRQQAILLSGLEQDLGSLYVEMISSQTFKAEEAKALSFYPNVKVMLADTLGEIDHILEEHINSIPVLKNIIDCKGFYLHKSILATRSEFMKKLMQYDLEQTENGMDVVYINNFSLSTLFTVFQFMYGGLSEEGFPLLFTENLVECFLAADMFLLFGLKKYAEQKICEQITLESVQDLYHISIIYNSDLIKDKCIEIMSKNNIIYESDIKKLNSTGSNGKSLSDVLKNDRESLLKNPIQLIQLIHHEIDHMVEKSRKIEGELSTHFLNKDSSMFVKKEDDDKNSSSPITMISQFVEKLNGSEGGVLASFPINTELVEKFKGSSDILLKAFDTIKDHLGDGSLVSGGCMFSIVACCVAAMLEEIENNAKEEWQKLYSEAKETIDEFKQKISSTLVETIAKLKEIGTETLNEIKRSIQKGCELASSFPKEVREEIENIAKRHLEEFKNVTNLMKHLKEKNFLTNQFEQFHQEFKALVTSFADRFIKELLGNIIGTIVKFFKSIAQVFRGLIKESFGIIIEIVKKIFEFVKSAPERLRKIFDFSGNCMAML